MTFDFFQKTLCALLLFPISFVQAQQSRPDSLSENASISLWTISPGNELYSAFGHSAIRVQDPINNFDRLYNYGTFDFNEPGFYVKFTRGQLDYFLSAYPTKYGIPGYIEEKRAVIEQILHLTPEMKNAIYAFLEWNYLPENRTYRYDFFFDNCATRIRDVFENILGRKLQWNLNQERDLTFRDYLDLYLGNFPFSHYGMNLGLGAKADRVATPRQAMFLPDFVYAGFANATVTIGERSVPLVAQTDTLLWFAEANRAKASPSWPAIILWMLFIFVAILTFVQFRSNKCKFRLDIPLFGIVGLLGVLIVFLWFFTDHKVTQNNWNILWAWPTHLLIAFSLLFRRRPPSLNWYFVLNALVMLLVLAGWSLWPQELQWASFPLILTLAVRSGWLAKYLRHGYGSTGCS